jgi:hypothetical protein
VVGGMVSPHRVSMPRILDRTVACCDISLWVVGSLVPQPLLTPFRMTVRNLRSSGVFKVGGIGSHLKTSLMR